MRRIALTALLCCLQSTNRSATMRFGVLTQVCARTLGVYQDRKHVVVMFFSLAPNTPRLARSRPKWTELHRNGQKWTKLDILQAFWGRGTGGFVVLGPLSRRLWPDSRESMRRFAQIA